MATFNLLVEDSSPLITYSPAGTWADIFDDPFITSYSGQSLHTTSAQGATATFTFNGTGVKLFGGRRPDYGAYTILVDGEEVTNGDASSASPTSRQLLGSVSGLADGQHIVVLRCDGGGSIDLDSLEMENGLQVTSTVIDDNDPQMQYLPTASAWDTNRGPAFYDNTLHFTQNPRASASLVFTGDAVAVYGTISPDHADIRVEIDGAGKTMAGGANGFVSALHPQTLLYYADNLGPGEHTLRLSPSAQEDTGPFLDIDSITTYAIISVNNDAPPPAPSQSSSSVPISAGTLTSAAAGGQSPGESAIEEKVVAFSKNALIAGVVGGVFGFLLLVGLFIFFLIRWRRRRRQHHPEDLREINDKSSPLSPPLPMQRTPVAVVLEGGMVITPQRPAVSFAAQQFTTSDRYSIASSYYTSRPETPASLSRASSTNSNMAMLPPVPILKQPKPKRKMTAGVESQGTGPPVRPSQRPPTLHFP